MKAVAQATSGRPSLAHCLDPAQVALPKVSLACYRGNRVVTDVTNVQAGPCSTPPRKRCHAFRITQPARTGTLDQGAGRRALRRAAAPDACQAGQAISGLLARDARRTLFDLHESHVLVVGIVVALLFLAAIWRVSLRHGPRQRTRARSARRKHSEPATHRPIRRPVRQRLVGTLGSSRPHRARRDSIDMHPVGSEVVGKLPVPDRETAVLAEHLGRRLAHGRSASANEPRAGRFRIPTAKT